MKDELPDAEINLEHTFINSISPVSERSFIAMRALMNYKKVSKDELFIKVNRPDHDEYILLAGLCRSFLVNPEKEEITLSFFRSPMVLSPHLTRTRNELSIVNYQALTDVELRTTS